MLGWIFPLLALLCSQNQAVHADSGGKGLFLSSIVRDGAGVTSGPVKISLDISP